MKPKPITVAIVEDDKGIRQSLEWLLKSTAEFSCVAACDSAEEALRVLPKLAPQVILMEWDPLESTCRHASLSIL